MFRHFVMTNNRIRQSFMQGNESQSSANITEQVIVQSIEKEFSESGSTEFATRQMRIGQSCLRVCA